VKDQVKDPVKDAVTLSLRAGVEGRIDLGGISPDRLVVLSESEIAALPVWVGRRACALGEVFDVKGERSACVRVDGDCSAVDGLGAGMTGGELIVTGGAGARVGAGLRGGHIQVVGNAGDDAGVGMSGGVLRVHGDVGHRVGAGAAGAAKGMTGGEIVVSGSAGVEAAARARRGLVVVMGDVGPDSARAMIAGSLVVFGRVGANPGSGNKRGSVVALGGLTVPETYAYACTFEPPHLRLTLTYLRRRYGLAIGDRAVHGRYRRYCGDAGVPGKGEILEWVG
jgi:formylmethanofuran dehydrogenase subunit C